MVRAESRSIRNSIYVADTGNDIIRKIDLNTLETSTLAGTGEEGDKDGPALQAQFNNPGAICTDGTLSTCSTRTIIRFAKLISTRTP